MKLEQREKGYWWPAHVKQAGLRYFNHAFDMNVALGYCKHKRVALQAGGHIGMWPIWLAERFEQVFTFEPDETNFACLTRNVTKHKPLAVKVMAYNAALNDRGGFVKLRQSMNAGGHSVESQNGVDLDGETASMMIDDFDLTTLDFLMLDIEGHELPALRGGAETIKRCRPVIQLEERGHGVQKGRGDTAADIVAFLDTLGYKHRGRVRNDLIFTPEG